MQKDTLLKNDEEKLIEAMRASGIVDAMLGDDATHWLIMITPEHMDKPIRIPKRFVRVARPEGLELLLRLKVIPNAVVTVVEL